MYFNKNKEDTNIDSEFSGSRKIDFDFEKYKKPLIIAGGIILLLIIILIIASASSKKGKVKYFIELSGPEEMAIGKGTTFTDPGYKGYDSKGNKYEVTVSGTVDTSKVGIYELTYALKTVSKTRRVKVVEAPNELTTIHLNGGKTLTIQKGSTYEEKGYNAIDFIDGDLTSSVKVSGEVDTSKPGIYRITYSVTNSKGITTVETRLITVE